MAAHATIAKLMAMQIEEAADTQSRVALSQETIDEYADAVRAGNELPPIDVFYDGATYFIADGWHRFHAWVAVEASAIPCIIHQGTARDALLFAAGANKDHGLRRTSADKRRAVELLLADREWSKWSNRKIAEHVGVGPSLVDDVRTVLELRKSETPQLPDSGTWDDEPQETPQKTRVGRDGKSYKAKRDLQAAPKPEGPDIEALAAPYRAAVKQLHAIRREMEALAAIPAGAHLAPKVQRLAGELNAAKGTIRQAEPLALCGKCGGKTCQHCSRTGFWPRAVVESIARK